MPFITNKDRERAKEAVSRLDDVERRMSELKIPDEATLRTDALGAIHEMRRESVDEVLGSISTDVLGAFAYDDETLCLIKRQTLLDIWRDRQSLSGRTTGLASVCADVERLRENLLAEMPVVLGADGESPQRLTLIRALYQLQGLTPARERHRSLLQNILQLHGPRDKAADIPGILKCLIMGDARRSEILQAIDALEDSLPRAEAECRLLDESLTQIASVSDEELKEDMARRPDVFDKLIRSVASVETAEELPAPSYAWLVRLASIRQELNELARRLDDLSAPDAAQRLEQMNALALELRHEHVMALLAQVDARMLLSPTARAGIAEEGACCLTLADAFEDGGVALAAYVGASHAKEALDTLSRIYQHLYDQIPCRLDRDMSSSSQEELLRALTLEFQQALLTNLRNRLVGRLDETSKETDTFLGAATLYEALFMGEQEREERLLEIDTLAGKVTTLRRDILALEARWRPSAEALWTEYESNRDRYDRRVALLGPACDKDATPKPAPDRARRIGRARERLAEVADIVSRCDVPPESSLLCELDRCAVHIRWKRTFALLDDIPLRALERFGADVSSVQHSTLGSYAREVLPEYEAHGLSLPVGTSAEDVLARVAHAIYAQVPCMDDTGNGDEDAETLIYSAVSCEWADEARQRYERLIALTNEAARLCRRLPEDPCHTLFMEDERRLTVDRMLLSAENAVEGASAEARRLDETCVAPTTTQALACYAKDAARYLSLIRTFSGSPCENVTLRSTHDLFERMCGLVTSADEADSTLSAPDERTRQEP